MLPRSHTDADRPQVPPGSVWITGTCSILFMVVFSCVTIAAPDQLRESLSVSQEPSLVSLQELADDDSRDPRNAILRNVRVESVAERKARDNTLAGIYRVYALENPALDQRGQEKLKLFLCADDILLPGSDEEAVAARTANTKDLRDAKELTGVLRRANPLAYRLGIIHDDLGIPHDAWLLHLDKPPHRAGETLFIVGSLLVFGSLMLLALLSQNWIPNRRLSFQPLSASLSLIGWPLRRYRDRWSFRLGFLITGAALIRGGIWCVSSGDRAMVIDAYFLEYWVAGVGLVMLGLAIVMRVAWVVCRPAKAVSRTAPDIQSEPDDERPTQDRPLTRLVVSVRTVAGGVWVTLLVARIVNNMAGQPVAAIAAEAVTWAIAVILGVYCCSHWLLITMTRGFREKSYEPLERTPRPVRAYRQRSDTVLENARFQRTGAYRVRGSAFHTNIELHLGCNGMVIAEFISLSGNKAIELTSITDSGICIVTASCAAPEGKPATRWSEQFYSHCGGTADFEQLLRGHLGAAADLAEQNDTAIAVLTQDDVIDVLKYSSRAMHDMEFQQRESRDRVGPAQYGRFRFPTGLREAGQEDNFAFDDPETAEDSLSPVSAGT